MNDLAEMASIAASYTARLTPESVRLSRIGRFIWIRFDVRSHVRFGIDSKPRSLTTNLVFRLAIDHPRPLNPTRPFRQLSSSSPPQLR